MAASTVDPALQHVYSVFEFSQRIQDSLFNAAKIKTLDDLLGMRYRLRDVRLRGVKKKAQRELFDFTCWYTQFKIEHRRKPHVPDEFDDDVYDNFVHKGNGIEKAKERMERELLTNDPQKLGEHLFALYEEGVPDFDEVLTADGNREALVDHIAGEVENTLSDYLKDNCFFEIDEVVQMTIESLLAEAQDKPLLVCGKTQSGKSAFKAVVLAVCTFMSVRTILVTTSKAESLDLCSKEIGYAKGSIAQGRIFSLYKNQAGDAGKNEAQLQRDFNDFSRGGATLVIPYTCHKLAAATRLVTNYQEVCESQGRPSKFALILDEADSTIRTKDGTLKAEQALTSLRNLGPSWELMVSATMMPVFLVYTIERNLDPEIFSIGTSDDYFGVDDMDTLRDAENHSVYLDKLSYWTGNIEFADQPPFTTDEVEPLFDDDEPEKGQFYSDVTKDPTIPCMDYKVKMLYDHALATGANGATGILVLDCTLSRVNVLGNVFQKAAKVQDMYRAEGTDIVVVAYVGRGVAYRFPGQKAGFLCSSRRKVSEVLHMIDQSFFGLDTPVFVFGYSKMTRVTSFRSSLRVPTHMVLYLGDGYGVEHVRQALGRATFNGKSLLKKNGHTTVTTLMREGDANVSLKYDNCVEEYQERYDRNETMAEIIGGTESKLPDSANYLRHTSRKTGQRPKRDDIGKLHDRNSFEEPPDELDEMEESTKNKYWDDGIAQRIIYVLYRLAKKDDNKHRYETEDIVEAYNDRYKYSDHDWLFKTHANKKLVNLKRDALVREIVVDTQKTWSLPHHERIRKHFVNVAHISRELERKRRAVEPNVSSKSGKKKKQKKVA